MPAREIITDAGVCDLARRWAVEVDTIQHAWVAAQEFEQQSGGTPVWIISGYRTRQEQRRLNRQGRPTAPDNVSTHRTCPATGLDISIGIFATNLQKAMWGEIALRHGLRVGGGGPVDEQTGLAIDWNHVDRGARRV